ncbi:N-acetylmuramoyl-L-alanine amidase [Nonomuraea sp. H19]|uniref:N-acetylmuramoyl-L-alanine amidase n=1 Tax=Nonomuraea sp. H19 TaxID=3452206 RepID=UPI003F89B009
MQIWLAAILTAGALTAPGDDLASAAAPLAPGERVDSGAAVTSGRQADFAAAAREFGVPVSVLLGVAYLGSRWDANEGRPSTAGGYGPMHLVDAVPVEKQAPGDALGDARGDTARPMTRTHATPPPTSALRMAAPQRTTLPEAGRLIGVEPARLRADPAANIRAGAALLASYQKHPRAHPAGWYEAIARFSGSNDRVAARQFADEVFAVMREGMERRTDDGHLVRLDPVPDLPAPGTAPKTATDQTATGQAVPDEQTAAAAQTGTGGHADTGAPADGAGTPGHAITAEQAETNTRPNPEPPSGTGPQTNTGPQTDTGPQTNTGPQTDTGALSQAADAGAGEIAQARPPAPSAGHVECPTSLACEWMPAAYKRFGKKNKDYGNHDRLLRARSVDYIVIHDMEGTYQGVPSMIRNPQYVSWHYTIRSRDGHVAQHVATKNIAWHAGNWDVNTRSIGIEHEGYLAKGGTWYTEAMYRASAKLVRYLAGTYDIPLNRAHILGHDNVPGTTPKTVAGMHDDPGPYWDWAHYFELLKTPLTAAEDGDSVMIRPSYNANRPRFTGCVTAKPARACPPHGAASVWLHKAPSMTAPLVTDVGKHGSRPSSYSVYDHAARASTGQRYAVAERRGDWTAIWYLGQKAWFHNPPSDPTAVPAKGPLVTPLRPNTNVYGRAYPEKSAYKQASYQPLTPLQYKIGPGQTYTVGDTITGSYYAADAFDPAEHVTTTGRTRYYQIQLGHRVMFVMAKDVRLIR